MVVDESVWDAQGRLSNTGLQLGRTCGAPPGSCFHQVTAVLLVVIAKVLTAAADISSFIQQSRKEHF